MYRLVTPLDGSPLAESALAFSIGLAEQFRGTLELVHVIDSESVDDDLTASASAEAERYLNHVAERFAGSVPIHVYVLHGHPVEELLRFFHQSDDTIVVMCRYGRTALRRSRFGGVAEELVHNAVVPILLIDDTRRDGDQNMKEILVPLDGSDLANSALPIAVQMASNLGRLSLVRVVQPPDQWARKRASPLTSHDVPESPHDVASVAIDEARGFLLRTATKLRQQGTTVSWEVRFGDPPSEILRASETAGAELIVIATHGWGGVRRWRFGSVTDAVIQYGGTPVLVVPPGRA